MKKRDMLTFSEFVRANREFEAFAEMSASVDKDRIKDAFYRKLKDVRQRLTASKQSAS